VNVRRVSTRRAGDDDFAFHDVEECSVWGWKCNLQMRKKKTTVIERAGTLDQRLKGWMENYMRGRPLHCTTEPSNISFSIVSVG
jgi:hypothetical protein